MTQSNKVLLTLTMLAALALAAGGFVSEAPNRLVSGLALSLWTAAPVAATFGIAALLLLLAAAAFARKSPALHTCCLAGSAALLLLLLYAAGAAAQSRMTGATPATRISLGAGFWIAGLAASLCIVDALHRLHTGPGLKLLVAIGVSAAIFLLAWSGGLDSLSIAREYANREGAFGAELRRHLLLVIGALGPALLIGLPLGFLAARREAFRGPLFTTLNVIETIPSVALFGLLIAPLSALALAVPPLGALGVRGIGPAPAVIALTLYALLPVARNATAGIAGIDRTVTEAAVGMGFTPRQVFWRVELPLALPVLIAGLRIVTVQTIGLAVVAALIGAGGLGTFVFQGIGQYAVDLVLLGAVPAILLALAADFLLTLLVTLAGRRRNS